MKSCPRVAYVGSVVPDEARFRTAAFSRSGNLFQMNALGAMATSGCKPSPILSYVPASSWPRGPVWVSGGIATSQGLDIRLLGFFNVTPMKQVWLGVSALISLIFWAIRTGWRAPKVICCYNLSVPPIAFLWLAGKLCNAKLVPFVCDINIPGETVPATLAHRLDFAQHRFWLPKMDSIIAVTDATVRDFARNVPSLLLEGGVPPAMQERIPPAQSPSADQEFVAVMAGSLEEFNGPRVAVDALRLAPDLKIRLVIAGDGPLREFIRTASAADGRIQYVGMLNYQEVLELYQKASLLLNIRLTRSVRTPYFFPGKLLEYLASGVPVLSTPCSHVQRKFSGMLYLASGEDAAAIADDLRRIAGLSRDERLGMGRKAQEWMLAEMTWNRQGQRMAEFLSRRGGPHPPETPNFHEHGGQNSNPVR